MTTSKARARRAADFICEAPGTPADPLGRWWWAENRPPVTIRRVRLTESPVHANAFASAVWPFAWQVTCHACPPGAPHPTYVSSPDGRQWVWNAWRSAAAFAIDHLRRDRHPS